MSDIKDKPANNVVRDAAAESIPKDEAPMAIDKKKTSRKSVSIRGATHSRISFYCSDKGKSVSGLLEELIDNFCSKMGVPEKVPPAIIKTMGE